MSHTTLITVDQLQALQAREAPLMLFDCSCDLMKPELGPAQYAEAHIPGAVYAHLDNALSAKGDPTAASGGRHPLPSREKFAGWLGEIGFDNSMQAVVYDRQGVNYAGRLWWMLKWLGHAHVAVLDGGFQAWQAAGLPVAAGEEAARKTAAFTVEAPLVKLVDVQAVQHSLGNARQLVLDARAAPRYRGETEPIDPVAGHIPGALNRPFATNMDTDGKFKPAAQLRAEFDSLLGQRAAEDVVHHCGSGVSAVPNILAMEIAGLHGSALFAGSWSEWVADPNRPVARG